MFCRRWGKSAVAALNAYAESDNKNASGATNAPTMTAAVESVSPISCTITERRFRSAAPRISISVMAPLRATPAAATHIINPVCTASGW
jgi:hypothetical protein